VVLAVGYTERMSLPEIDIRPGRPGDWPAVSGLLAQAFHNGPDAWGEEIEGHVYEPGRGLLAEDDDRLVAHASAFTRDLTVPGAIVPAAHVTLVGVAPTHRRRHLLTRMMHRQLSDIRNAGVEPIAVLWASEGAIYPRYGYGLAAQKLQLAVSHREVSLPAAPPGGDGRLRLVDPAAAQPRFAELYESVRAERPGWSSRDARWWRFVLADPASRRHGATPLNAVVHETPRGITGYALWHTKGEWTPTGPNGEVQVREVIAADPQAYLALWRMLLSIDLTRITTYSFAAVDEPLLHLVDHPRRLGGRLNESLWVRLVDVPRALAARRYAAPVDVVLEVTDPLLDGNAGRWRLVADRESATCTPTDAPADLACDVLELGSAYLGGVSLAVLGAAGRVRELTPGALAIAGVAFGWHRLPAAAEVF
jgi:predicted acetyltransferase